MDIQRLRNLTTGRLHTTMGDIYKDIETLVGAEGIMTHMLPRAADAMRPWLELMVTDKRFWDGKYDTTHTGDIDLRPMNASEQEAFWHSYGEMPNPLAGKEVVVVEAA
jgi:hypothetical protein